MTEAGNDRVRFEADGTVTVFTGKVEIGQGITTALAQIAADELGIPIERVRVAPPDTSYSPDEGVTSGSRSIEESGEALRHAAAAARGATEPRTASERTVIGTRVERVDLPAKIAGRPSYVQDLVLPGMLHGRVVRSPNQAATLASVDEAELRALPGVVAVVRDGSFLAVVTDGELPAIRALARARRLARWNETASLPPSDDPRYVLRETSEDHVHAEKRDDAALARSERRFSAEFSRPFIAHGALAPSCAVARLDGDRYTVWSHTQGIYPLRAEIARILGVAEDAVRVIHMEGAGCYGHNGADDVALDAALLARAVPGRPIRVQWMRDDEFAWEPYGTAAVVRVSAALDGDGRIVDWTHEIWGHGHGNRPGRVRDPETSSLLAASQLARGYRPTTSPRGTSLTAAELRNAEPGYDFPNQRVVDHYVARSPFRVSALRTLGAHLNVFAIESSMDELAEIAGQGPLAFRLAHLRDPRARAVLETVAARAGWSDDARSDGTRAQGLAFARYKNAAAYFAAVAEVALEEDIRVTRVWGAVDAGMAVSPDGLANQAEGGIVQATSWTLKERIRHDDTRVTSLGWDTYPVLRFSEAPEVDVTVIDRPDQPPLGAGEAFAPTTAAIANAVDRACAVRLRDLPLTRERLLRD